jgi:hypothetical protein
MFTFEKQKQKFRAWARREIAREAQNTMLTYQAARQSLDLYEMRLETLDTRLCKRIRELEDRVANMEAALSLYVDQDPHLEQRKAG